MKYYLFEASRKIGGSMTAGVKARCDVEDILEHAGYERLTILQAEHPSDTTANKLRASAEIAKQWKALVAKLKKGDILVVQLPLSEHTLSFGAIIAGLRRKGVRTVAVVHDLERFRNMKAHNPLRAWKGNIRNYLEETAALKHFYRIIVHNPCMLAKMEEMGYRAEKMVSLDIFDYVIEEEKQVQRVGDPEAVIVAGNLLESKAGYVYKLPEDERVQFSLYGVNYTGKPQSNVAYHGAFDPDELPFVLSGKYGLVWDGPQADTCGGIHGQYLRINNPHKTSLYLASGIPVIIWKEAALARFVEAHGVGICVESLDQIPEAFAAVSPEAYEQMRENTLQLSQKLRAGGYLRKALEACGC